MRVSNYDTQSYQDFSRPDGKLNVHSCLEYSRNGGPGKRFLLWLQGCAKRCPGCINPDMLSTDKAMQLMDSEEVVKAILSAKNSVTNIEGITLYGGEPTLQAQNLIPVLKAVKENDLNTIIFSGYTLEELLSFDTPYISAMLAHTDVLIDGSFESDQMTSNTIAGSSNQTIHHLSDEMRDADFTRIGQQTILDLGQNQKITSGLTTIS